MRKTSAEDHYAPRLPMEINLPDAGHVVYIYSSENSYLENTLSFINNSINLGQGIIYIDHKERYEYIKQRLVAKGASEELIESIAFGDSIGLYLQSEYKEISKFLVNLSKPMLTPSRNILLWANVEWKDLDHFYNIIKKHEEFDDVLLKGSNIIAVCAYDGNKLNAKCLLEVMKSHEYIMSDTQLYPSSLYEQSDILDSIIDDNDLQESLLELNRYKEELARLDQLNIIGQMAASISHEVRNPMTAVRGFLQMLSQKVGCIEYEEYFKLMIDELDRANNIITEFLSLSRYQGTQLELYDINKIITTLLPLLESDAIRREVSIKIDLGEVPPVFVNPKQIKQVIINLVKNGLEVTPKGESLIIRTYIVNDNVVLEIEDKGPGIPEEIIEKVGKPFFTTKPQGTGLGLSICYKIVEKHGAIMDFVTSDKGTTFRVIFKYKPNVEAK